MMLVATNLKDVFFAGFWFGVFVAAAGYTVFRIVFKKAKSVRDDLKESYRRD